MKPEDPPARSRVLQITCAGLIRARYNGIKPGFRRTAPGKENAMHTPNQEKLGWSFYVLWVVLTTAALAVAWAITVVVLGIVKNIVGDTMMVDGVRHITEDYLASYIVVPLAGVLIGVFQHILLRRAFPRLKGWWLATVLGFLLGFGLIYLFSRVVPQGGQPGTIGFILGMALVGAAISLPQWWLLRSLRSLRSEFPQSGWWLLAGALGWAIIGVINFTLLTLPVALTTALALWWMQQDRVHKPAAVGA